MDFRRLEQNLMDVIQEEQIKLGYREEVVRFYYPLASVNHFLKSDMTAEEMQEALMRYFASAQSNLGKVHVSHRQDRFCFMVPGTGVKYVHEHSGENAFLAEFIGTIGKHGCRIDDLRAVFERYSGAVHFEEIAQGEFNYLLYFADGQPDAYRYCIADEGCHLIYHRFTQEDYADLQ